MNPLDVLKIAPLLALTGVAAVGLILVVALASWDLL